MSQAENLISFYQMGFKVCIGLAVLFLVLTVVLFFRFNIRGTIANRSGRARKKTIEQMREANERTGRLKYAGKVAMGEYTPMSLGDGKTDETQGSRDGRPAMEETMPLEPPQAAGSPKGSLPGSPKGSLSGRKKKKPYAGKFVITKEVLLIHTDEWV